MCGTLRNQRIAGSQIRKDIIVFIRSPWPAPPPGTGGQAEGRGSSESLTISRI